MRCRRRISRPPSAASASQPALPDQRFQLTVQTQGRLSSVEEFGNVVVRADPGGSFVRVRDVARVELAARLSEQQGRQDGGPAAVIGIYQAPGGNAIASAEAVRGLLDEAKKQFPEGMDYKITYDTTVFVAESIHEVIKTLVEAFALVVIVVFIFLGSLRATIIPADRRARLSDRHLRRDDGDGILRQYRLAAGAGAGHRHRRR